MSNVTIRRYYGEPCDWAEDCVNRPNWKVYEGVWLVGMFCKRHALAKQRQIERRQASAPPAPAAAARKPKPERITCEDCGGEGHSECDYDPPGGRSFLRPQPDAAPQGEGGG